LKIDTVRITGAPTDVMTPSNLLMAAVRQHQAGRFDAADELYRQAIAADPADMHALHLAGVLAHQTNRDEQAVALIARAIALDDRVPDFHYNIGLALWALGRRQQATTHWARVTALNPDHAEAHMNLGNALREQGRLAEAVTHLRRAAALRPQSPVAHNNLGLALAGLGDRDAVAHYRQAIALQPQFIEPYLNLALEFVRHGRADQALACARRALQIVETSDTRALFARVVGTLDAVPDDPGLRALVIRAATEGWGRARDLAGVAATLVKQASTIEAQVARAAPAWPAAAAEPLLRWLLESTVICDGALERFLTATRAALLETAATAPDASDENQLAFACALARQCFGNEYVYATTALELDRVARLRAAGADISPLCLAVIGAYEPLHALPDADALLARSWPVAVAALLTQQVREPREEALARASVVRLTPIEDDVSRLVQAQYEQNPYPRWVAAGQQPRYESVDALMQRDFPHAPFRPTGKADLDILVAGCGTGRHSIGVAQQFERSRVLAVDLSAASLAYAAVRARALGVTNVEHAQADILLIGSIGRTFDVIQSAGVLHHLRDPWAGWCVLLALLRPNGLMSVALYSEVARRDVVAARQFIAERGYGATAAEIRACRQELMTHEDGTPLKNVTLFNDFFTTSECRDLLFHVQEHRMTLSAIKRFLDANGLTFLGFELDARVTQRYAARFPDDTAMTDLDRWHAFEQDNPDTFASMYRFWVQKSD
jgi:Flp pilus assembly protein TadD/SAM-dependent methyltransferase